MTDRPVHPAALIGASAQVAEDVQVGPFAVIEDGASVGARSEIRAHAVVKRFTRMGEDNVVHEGAVLGGEPQDLSFTALETRLVIGDRNRIREGATLHRGSRAGSDTTVGSDCFVMAYAHVAHDCHLGNHAILANNVALAGHVTVGERAFLSGGVVVHQFCRIGRLAMIGGNSKVVQDCLPFVITDGTPARARGLNVVGLKRAGVTSSQLATLKEAYRVLLRAGLPLAEALVRLAALQDPLVDELATFARQARRGFAHAVPRARPSA